jgi:hypothetical protein
MQLYNYQAGDYIIVIFNGNNTGNNYLLASSYIGLSYSAYINNIAVTTTAVNSTAIRITMTNQTLPSLAKPVLTVLLCNLSNPAFVATLSLTLDTYDSPSGGRK